MEMPKQVGPFKVLRELGRGGMGGVFLAEDPRLGRQVALKILLPKRQEGSEGTARLLKEAKAAAKLDHPNVCAIYEVGESASGTYIAMQYVEGETIDAVLARSRPSLREVTSWGLQIAEALTEAHRQGILHRDIKPQNLMVTPKGQVKVLDFGLAKVMAQGSLSASAFSLLTQDGVVMGTVPYMSPEQVRSDELDGRSDVFSLGSVLFEAATGRRPFPSTHSADLMSEILLKDPFWDGAGDHLPKDFRAVLAMALQKKKGDRYTSAEALASDLRVVLNTLQDSAGASGGPFPGWTPPSGGGHPALHASGDALTSAFSPSQGLRVAKQARRWWLISAISAALIIPSAYFALPAFLARQPALESIAVLPFTCEQGNTEADSLCDGLTEQLINQLARIPNLKVIARSSVMRYKGATPDLKALAKELGVKAVLTGRLEKRGDQLAFSAEVVEASSQRQLLGEKYTGTAMDILTMQDRLLRDLGRKSLATLPPSPAAPKVSGEAFDFYLRAKRAMGKSTLEGVQQAFGYLDEALRLSPGFAQAQATRAYGYLLLSSQYLPSSEALPLLQAAAEKALELDPQNAEAHTLLALALAHNQFDFKGAEQRFRRSIELAPGAARAHELYGYFLTAMGRKNEAAKELDRALELDPLSPNVCRTKGVSCFFGHDWEGALKFAQREQALEPLSQIPKLGIARTLAAQGQWAASLKSVSEIPEPHSYSILTCKGVALAKLGKREEALIIIKTILNQSGNNYPSELHYQAAQIFAAFGDQDKAIEMLRISKTGKEEAFIFSRVDPFLEILRTNPQFQELTSSIK